jgi:hypothetical protein
MLYQKDYILRMIEMIGELIAAILGNIKKGEYKQAEEAIENAYYEYLKEDAAFFRRIPAEDLTTKLIQKHNYTNGHLEILAELFFAEAEFSFAMENYTASMEYYQKSKILFGHVINESRAFSIEKDQKISLINDRIAKLKESLNK